MEAEAVGSQGDQAWTTTRVQGQPELRDKTLASKKFKKKKATIMSQKRNNETLNQDREDIYGYFRSNGSDLMGKAEQE